MLIKYHSIVHGSLVDGPGARSVVFLQGCSIRCPGCQNSQLWRSAGGKSIASNRLADLLCTGIDRPSITISGGEPTDQAPALLQLLVDIRGISPGAHVILYSGRTLGQIFSSLPAALAWRIMLMVDVLVDGPYIAALDHDRMQHRGSSNQRVIDMPATIDAGDFVLLDWDAPEVSISSTGEIVTSAGLTDALALDGLGVVSASRICGAVTCPDTD